MSGLLMQPRGFLILTSNKQFSTVPTSRLNCLFLGQLTERLMNRKCIYHIWWCTNVISKRYVRAYICDILSNTAEMGYVAIVDSFSIGSLSHRVGESYHADQQPFTLLRRMMISASLCLGYPHIDISPNLHSVGAAAVDLMQWASWYIQYARMHCSVSGRIAYMPALSIDRLVRISTVLASTPHAHCLSLTNLNSVPSTSTFTFTVTCTSHLQITLHRSPTPR